MGIDSRMRVIDRGSGDPRVVAAGPGGMVSRGARRLQKRWQRYLQRNWATDNPVLHTFGQIGAGAVRQLNASDADLLNLHWIAEILSVKDIGRLQKPVVWTLHDMWAFCGGEHYVPDGDEARFRSGYHAANRPVGERGPDLNRMAWEAKRRSWARKNFTVVSPSHWLADCARQSVLFADSPIQVIPNPLDTEQTWRPIDQNVARTLLGLPQRKKLLLFGAEGGVTDPRKGADLLREAVSQVAARAAGEIELLIYGQSVIRDKNLWPCPVHWLGAVRDDHELARIYAAADVMVVPSRQDNLPNSAVEAQSCGTPVAAFEVGGLPDIVHHRETGWLAKAFDVEDLANGISWLLADNFRHQALRSAARQRAVAHFSEPVVAQAYYRVYEQVMNRQGRSD